jgi:hypothetical protein
VLGGSLILSRTLGSSSLIFLESKEPSVLSFKKKINMLMVLMKGLIGKESTM